MRPPYAPPALQAVKRDFAFLVPQALEADQLIRAVRNADKKAIVEARLFDVFIGQGVPEGKKSLAIEATLQPADKRFTEEELRAISMAIVKAAEKLGDRKSVGKGRSVSVRVVAGGGRIIKKKKKAK